MTEKHRLLSGLRVLIVEDEALIAIAVEEEARRLGAADIFIAYNKPQALDEIEQFKPDFAVLDVSLTDTGSDYGIADILADRGIPFVFSSGHLREELPHRHSGRPFVNKPMMPDDFDAAVATALR